VWLYELHPEGIPGWFHEPSYGSLGFTNYTRKGFLDGFTNRLTDRCFKLFFGWDVDFHVLMSFLGFIKNDTIYIPNQ